MVTNVDVALSAAKSAVPGQEANFVYFSGAKAAQNDTITLTGVTEILWANTMIEPSSGDRVMDTTTRDDTTINMINLTGATAGTAHVVAIVKI